jgi:hypothetical protein
MAFDPQAIFANLAEKEKIKGHHSPEGRVMRTLSRALNGWSTKTLSSRDVVALCDQAMEDWLKARLKISTWSVRPAPKLIATAVDKDLITRLEAVSLQRIHNLRARLREEGHVAVQEVNTTLEFCIQLVEKRW